jgi:hypothetical protein
MPGRSEVMAHLTRKLLGYALGRALNNFDKCVVDDSLSADGGRLPRFGHDRNDRAQLSVPASVREEVGKSMARTMSRRTFLRGTGVALGLPLLEAMEASADPRRERLRSACA